jgi:nucleoside-diphosphate-sugar epimerase
MGVFIFGAGTIGVQISKRLQGSQKVNTLISSKFFEDSHSELNSRRIPYGNLHKMKMVSEKDTCIVTTRVDLINEVDKEMMFRDLEYLSQSGLRFLNLSSVAVYGSSANLVSEEVSPNPNNEYGMGKLNVEKELSSFISPDRLTHLRVANLFGLTKFKDITNTAALTFQSEATFHVPIKDCKRDFVPFDDFASFIQDWIDEEFKSSGVLNFSTANSIAVADWVNEIGNHFGISPKIICDLEETLPLSLVNNEKLKSIWGRPFSNQMTSLHRYLTQFVS